MNDFVNMISVPVDWIAGQGNEVLLVLAVIAVHHLLRMCKGFPDDWIPLVTCLVAVAGEFLLGEVPVESRAAYPKARLVLIGLIIWLIAWLLEAQVLNRLKTALNKRRK
jgi:hypothetical protein